MDAHQIAVNRGIANQYALRFDRRTTTPAVTAPKTIEMLSQKTATTPAKLIMPPKSDARMRMIVSTVVYVSMASQTELWGTQRPEFNTATSKASRANGRRLTSRLDAGHYEVCAEWH